MRRWIVFLVLAAVALGSVAAGVVMRNELVALDVAAEAQWQQVETQLQRRHDLLPKLVAVAQRYAAHERGVLEQVAASRAAYAGAPAAARPKLAAELDGALVHVLALAEQYPDLKADQHFRDLSYEISGTENRIAVERLRYNEVVAQRNARLRQLPWSLLKGSLAERPYYAPPRAALADPQLGL